MTPQESLQTWAQQVRAYHIPRYDELPGIDLYMDQVVAVIDDYLRVFMRDEKERHITPAMINNYVKLKILPPPVKKRYNRSHLCYLIVICLLKPTLAIPEIRDILLEQLERSDMRTVYNGFCDIQEEAICATLERVALPQEDSAAAFSCSALHIAVHGGVSKMIAERILDVRPVPSRKA